MKTKPVILLAAISALLVTGAAAQQEAPPAGAPPTPPGARDGAPPPDRPRDGEAPKPGGPRDGGRPDGPRGEGFRPGGREGGFPGGPGPREGGPGGPRVESPRDGANPGGPREGGGPRGPHEGAGPGGPRDGAGPNPGPGRSGPPLGFPGGPREGGSPGEFHRGPRDGGPEGAPEVRKEKRAFLGIVAAPLPPVLTAQLGLSEGYGLVVQAVAPESPAAKAGIQKYDVIKLLNDQQIVDQGQLATLVKGIGTGKEVTLTVLRKAQEQKITATLGEHEVTVGGPEHHGFGGLPGRSPGLDARGPEHLKELGDRMREFQEQLRKNPERAKEMQEKMRDFQQKTPDGRGPREGFGRPGAAVDPERLLREAKPSGGAEIRVETQAGSTTINGAQAHLRLKDASGEIEVATEDGKRVLTARDPEGKVIFTGPVNTDEERAAVPEPIRKKLADIHIRQDRNGNGVTSSISLGEGAAVSRAEETFDEADFQ
ncbi:MAG TPA: PDZ domain-containing protein [Chthoniobacteraceae bacterium]|jgi:hypothetical protein|nr:PDZ domain-containing protein [Chthoniobacteraceae bacterium]